MTRPKPLASAAAPGPAADAPPPGGHATDLEVGGRIRSLRRARGISLKQVAERAELSIGFLSQLERGISSASIRVLARLADALEVGIAEIYGGSTTESPLLVARVNERKRFDFPESGMAKEVLTPFGRSPRLDIFIISMAPGGDTGDPPFCHQGEEAGVVLEGGIELIVDGQLSILGQGDSFRFSSELPHRYRNAGPRPARVMWVNWRDKPIPAMDPNRTASTEEDGHPSGT